MRCESGCSPKSEETYPTRKRRSPRSIMLGWSKAGRCANREASRAYLRKRRVCNDHSITHRMPLPKRNALAGNISYEFRIKGNAKCVVRVDRGQGSHGDLSTRYCMKLLDKVVARVPIARGHQARGIICQRKDVRRLQLKGMAIGSNRFVISIRILVKCPKVCVRICVAAWG